MWVVKCYRSGDEYPATLEFAKFAKDAKRIIRKTYRDMRNGREGQGEASIAKDGMSCEFATSHSKDNAGVSYRVVVYAQWEQF